MRSKYIVLAAALSVGSVSIAWSSTNYQALQPLFDPYATAATPPNAIRVRSAVPFRASRVNAVAPLDRRRRTD